MVVLSLENAFSRGQLILKGRKRQKHRADFRLRVSKGDCIDDKEDDKEGLEVEDND